VPTVFSVICSSRTICRLRWVGVVVATALGATYALPTGAALAGSGP
jgi:hypothetical protein